MKLRKISSELVKNKAVLLRTDFNVPLHEGSGEVVSDYRIKAALPTIELLQKRECKEIIIISHLGRPEGKHVQTLSLRPVHRVLEQLLGEKVAFGSYMSRQEMKSFVEKNFGKIMLLENIRFFPEEEENDSSFVQDLADLADIYVNDAFSVCHREHASTYGIAQVLPSFAGLRLEEEYETLQKFDNPETPLVVIIGGAKVKDKAAVIKHFENAESILLGGAMANTFLKASGVDIGSSYYVESELGLASKLLKVFGEKLVLPVDTHNAYIQDGKWNGDLRRSDVGDVREHEAIYDIGEKTIKEYCKKISKAKTVFWAGPLGLFEKHPFEEGSEAIGDCLAHADAYGVVGGGDTLSLLEQYKLIEKFEHVLTGGGASLAYLAGKELPGLEVLKQN